MRDKHYDNRQYRQARSATDEFRVELSLNDTVACIVKHMLHDGLIPKAEKAFKT